MPAKRIFLKGIDYFQLLIDHHSKKKGGRGHEARLAIFLKGQTEEKTIKELILNSAICQQLAKARISKTFGIGYPSLYFTNSASAIPVSFYNVESTEIPQSFLNVEVEVYKMPPLHLQVLYLKNGTTCLLFTLHHILFDFAGVQSLIESLAGKNDVPLLPEERIKKPFINRLTAFFKAVFFTFREANSNMSVLQKPLPQNKPFDSNYKEITFTSGETKLIYENCVKSGLQLNHSIYFLAAACKSLHDNFFIKQQYHKFLWVPVPVNVRRKGKADAVLFNGLSFLFYKLKPEVLGDMQKCINNIKLQMKEQVRNEMPDAFIEFADGYRFIPMPFYYPMLKLPSSGKLSSFSFSVLGKTFFNLNEFLNLPVIDVKNYPSNSTSPGITFLFYEFRGELKMMSSWVKGQYSDEEQNEVILHLRKLLLQPLASTSS